MFQVIELNDLGRLLSYDPVTGSVKVLLDSLYMPNGIVLSPDESFLLLAETSIGRILKYKRTRSILLPSLTHRTDPQLTVCSQVLAEGPKGRNQGNHHGQYDRLP